MQVKLLYMPFGYRQADVVKSQLFGDFSKFECLHLDGPVSPFPNEDLRHGLKA